MTSSPHSHTPLVARLDDGPPAGARVPRAGAVRAAAVDGRALWPVGPVLGRRGQGAIRGGAAIPDENAVGLHGCSKLLIVDGIVVTAVSSDSWAVPTAVRGRLCEIFSGASRHDPHPWEVIDPEDRRVVTANSNLDSAKIQFAETDKQVRGSRTAVSPDEEANL